MSTAGPLKDRLDLPNDVIEDDEKEKDPTDSNNTDIYNIQNIEINDSVVIDTKFTTDEN